jgi:hypothetical protein
MVVNSDSPLCICDFSQSCRSNGSFFLLGRRWFQNSGHLLLTFGQWTRNCQIPPNDESRNRYCAVGRGVAPPYKGSLCLTTSLLNARGEIPRTARKGGGQDDDLRPKARRLHSCVESRWFDNGEPMPSRPLRVRTKCLHCLERRLFGRV